MENINVDVVASPEEQDIVKDALAAVKAYGDKVRLDFTNATRFKIETAKKKVVDAMTTPLWKVEDIFMREQEGRGNTEKTLRYYRTVWHRLYDFFAFHTSATTEDYKRLLESEKAITLVKSLPLVALQIDDFQAEFRYYLIQVVGNGEQTVQKYMRGVRAIMKYVAENGWLDTPHIKVKDIDPPIKATYSDKDLETMARKPDPDDFVEYRNWVIARYTMATSNRAGSIAGLMVGDIDFDEGYVNVNVAKNRQPIRIPLVRDILRELREYVLFYRSDNEGNPLVDERLFITQFEEPMTAESVSRAFRDFCKRRGLTKASIHLLRHTFAKRFIVDGGDILSLKAMLGHKSLKMVNHYARIYGTDIRDKVEKHSLIGQTKIKSGRKKIVKRV